MNNIFSSRRLALFVSRLQTFLGGHRHFLRRNEFLSSRHVPLTLKWKLSRSSAVVEYTCQLFIPKMNYDYFNQFNDFYLLSILLTMRILYIIT